MTRYHILSCCSYNVRSQVISPFYLNISADTSLFSEDSHIQGLRWHVITQDVPGYYLEFSVIPSNSSDIVFILKGSLIGTRIVGSVFMASKNETLGHIDPIVGSGFPVYVKGKSESWWNPTRKMLAYGTFQMRKFVDV